MRAIAGVLLFVLIGCAFTGTDKDKYIEQLENSVTRFYNTPLPGENDSAGRYLQYMQMLDSAKRLADECYKFNDFKLCKPAEALKYSIDSLLQQNATYIRYYYAKDLVRVMSKENGFDIIYQANDTTLTLMQEYFSDSLYRAKIYYRYKSDLLQMGFTRLSYYSNYEYHSRKYIPYKHYPETRVKQDYYGYYSLRDNVFYRSALMVMKYGR